MFDPTAFDNMKVVIEGALYDLEFLGDIVVKDRNDLVNIAKMSRRFDITFTLAESRENPVEGKIKLESNLHNLASELLPGALDHHEEGCQVMLAFVMELSEKDGIYDQITNTVEDVWGETRNIRQTISYDPTNKEKKVRNDINIGFNRLIREEQIDDLVKMIEFMVATIRKLEKFQF